MVNERVKNAMFLLIDPRIYFYFYLDFFKKKNVPVMTVKELFDFVTDPTIVEANMQDYLDKLMKITSTRNECTGKDKVDDEVLMMR